MTGDTAAADGRPRQLHRRDDRLGLAVARAGLSGRTLVTYARDHVTVRTPSRPGLSAGNTLDLLTEPEPHELAAWVERFRTTVAALGADTPQLRFEVAAADDEGEGEDRAVQLPEPLLAAADALGLEVRATSVLLLAPPDELQPPSGSLGGGAELVPIAPPAAVPGGAVDRRWHAATVLYRYAEGDTPDDWRRVDQAAIAWSVEVQRELATAGRAQVWLALRHGTPVGRLTVLHDRQGLAVVEDLIVHPVHRGLGIATALLARALGTHLAADPGTRVGVGCVPGSAAERIGQRLGLRPHATIWTLRGRAARSR